MSFGKMGRSHCIRFRTNQPIDYADHKLYQNEFRQFSSTGLWLEYSTGKGTAYFANEENANEAYRSLKANNNLNMRLDTPARSTDEYRSEQWQNKPKRKDYEADDIETSVDMMFDIFGNEVPVLTSNEGKEYIPVECVESSGYRLFRKPLIMQESNEHWNTKLKMYLLNQALLYVYMNKVHYDSKSIIPLINSVLSDMGVKTKNSPGSSVCSNNNHQENDTKSQDVKRMRPKTETLELDVTHEVQFLNDHADGVYYIRVLKNEDTYNLIQADTMLHANNGQRIAATPNRIVAAKYNNVWHRAVLWKSTPVTEYFFIDIGKFVSGKLETRSLSEDLIKIPGQAIRVRLTQSCTAKEHQIADMVATKLYPDGTYLIQPPEKSGFTSDASGRSYKEERRPNFQSSTKTTPVKKTDDFNDENNAADEKPALRMPKIEPALNSINNAISKTPSQIKDNFTGGDRQVIKQNNNISITTSFGSARKSPVANNPISPASSTSSLNRVTTPNRPQMSKMQAMMLNLNKTVKIEKSVPGVKSSRKCISEFLANTNGCMEYMDMSAANSFIAFILPCTKLDDITLLESITGDAKFNASYRPSVGDTVAVDFLQDGEPEASSVRAVVLETNNKEYKVALVDYGKIIKVDKVMELPEKYMDILEYASCCTVDKAIMSKIKEQLRFNYHSENNGELIIDLDGNPQKVVCEKWNPFPSSTENSNKQDVVFTIPSVNPVQSGEAVKLICQENDFLGIRTRENFLMLKDILAELQTHEVEKLQSPPVVNQIVLYKEANDLHRAQVKLITGNLIKVFKIDYGSTEMTDVGNLYYIGKFSKYGHTLSLLKLAGYSEGYENRTVQDYLKTLFKTMKFTVTSATGEIIDLLLPNNISLTQKLTLLAKPPFKRLEDIPPAAELPVGSTRVLLLHVQDLDHCDITVTVCDSTIQEEFIKLSAKLPTCENIPASLVFNLGQACVGKYDGGWYRACITEVDNINEQYLVYFFDFGNYERVSIDDLRELPEEMANFGAMALKCHINDAFHKFCGNVPLEYKEKLMDCVGSDIEIKVLSKHGDLYNINIPELQ